MGIEPGPPAQQASTLSIMPLPLSHILTCMLREIAHSRGCINADSPKMDAQLCSLGRDKVTIYRIVQNGLKNNNILNSVTTSSLWWTKLRTFLDLTIFWPLKSFPCRVKREEVRQCNKNRNELLFPGLGGKKPVASKDSGNRWKTNTQKQTETNLENNIKANFDKIQAPSIWG